MTLFTGPLAGVNTGGSASQRLYQTGNNYFLAPIAVGGVADQWIWALGVPCQSDADCMDDNNPCTLTQCSNGACLYPADPQGVCPDDGNSCTDDMCTNGSCVHPNNTDPCDDEDACTDLDTCNQGDCVGSDIACNDANLCSLDSCDSQMGCVYDFQAGCCTVDEDCMPGEICLVGSNSCIPDPDPTGGDTTTDTTTEGGSDTTTDGGSDTTTTTTTEGGSDTTTDTSGESGSDGTGSADEVGEDVGTLDTFGGTVDDGGCNCSADDNGTGALFGLLGLGLLGLARRRD